MGQVAFCFGQKSDIDVRALVYQAVCCSGSVLGNLPGNIQPDRTLVTLSVFEPAALPHCAGLCSCSTPS